MEIDLFRELLLVEHLARNGGPPAEVVAAGNAISTVQIGMIVPLHEEVLAASRVIERVVDEVRVDIDEVEAVVSCLSQGNEGGNSYDRF